MTRVVLALHGFTGSGASFSRLAARLPDVRFVTPALLGHEGESSARTFGEEVDRLRALRATLPADTTLLGYSLGGRLALAMLARGDTFARAVIIGAAVGLADEAARTTRRGDDARFVRLLREEGIDAFVAAWEAQPIFATQRDAARSALRRSHDPEGLARSLEVLGLAEMPYLLPALETVRTPIDYLAGERDPKLTGVGRMLAARVPSIRLHVVPGVGHDVLLEAPEQVAACLDAPLTPKERETIR